VREYRKKDSATLDFWHLGPSPASILPAWLRLPSELSDGFESRIRLQRLAFNARYLALGLKKLGFITYFFFGINL
jgi:serine palmitoyltransferase